MAYVWEVSGVSPASVVCTASLLVSSYSYSDRGFNLCLFTYTSSNGTIEELTSFLLLFWIRSSLRVVCNTRGFSMFVSVWVNSSEMLCDLEPLHCPEVPGCPHICALSSCVGLCLLFFRNLYKGIQIHNVLLPCKIEHLINTLLMSRRYDGLKIIENCCSSYDD